MRDKEFRQYAMPAQPAAQPDFEKKLSSTANNVNKRPVQLPSAGIHIRGARKEAVKPTASSAGNSHCTGISEQWHEPKLFVIITVHAEPASSQRLRYKKTK